MASYEEINLNKVTEAWMAFIKNDTPINPKLYGVRKFVFDSWMRSKNYGVNFENLQPVRLSSEEFEALLRENKSLIGIAQSYMNNLYSFVKEYKFTVSLSNKDGCILSTIGDTNVIKSRAANNHLLLGSVRSEKFAGTNAIGTCLVLDKPLQIFGSEHYSFTNHNFVCSAAPIHDENGNIIGCLNFTGPKDHVAKVTLSVVLSAVDGIEKGIWTQTANKKLTMMNYQLLTTIQAINSGIIMLDKHGFINQYNDQARRILRLPAGDLRGEKLSDYINGIGTPPSDFRNFQNQEIEYTTSLGANLRLSISSTIIYNEMNEPIGVVLVLEELHKVHTLVNKMSGFTAKYTFDSVIGDSESMLQVKQLGCIAAKSESNVLILGESGTGKELIAQAIHNTSTRASGPFIAINCGSIPKGLIESEFFGYERGAFTGANREGHPGKFELADGGTIFLDEIGDMPLDLQASLLRVLQSKELVRIGGTKAKKINVRIIAATNVNLAENVLNKRFRSDLYYRLNVFTIEIPPLRTHIEDIPLLVEYFIAQYNRSMKKNVKGITEEVLDIFNRYHWPGNVRELENIIERSLNFAQSSRIEKKDIPKDLILKPLRPDTNTSEHKYASHMINNFEFDLIISHLRKTYGNITKAALLMGVSRRSLNYKIKKYDINVDEFRNEYIKSI